MLTRQEAESKLQQKAAEDPKFRAELMADPAAAIQKAFGVALPPGTRITVLEEKADQHYLVLPPKPENGPLKATQLDSVAAGGPYPDYTGC